MDQQHLSGDEPADPVEDLFCAVQKRARCHDVATIEIGKVVAFSPEITDSHRWRLI